MTVPTPEEKDAALDAMVTHMRDCRKADAATVVDGSADTLVEQMLAEGWTMQPQVDLIGGKRLRVMVPPASGGPVAGGAS